MYDDFFSAMKKEIAASTGDYDLFSPRLIDSSTYMQEGYFVNLLTAPNIDLKKPWYNQQGIEEMAISYMDGRYDNISALGRSTACEQKQRRSAGSYF